MNEKTAADRTDRADRGRWERLVMRHPGQVLPILRELMQKRDAAVARPALLGAFFVLERWGRAAELQEELEAALLQAERQRALPLAAELNEALGRLHYQRGDYAQACKSWSQTLDRAADDSRAACLARIGLAHLCYALGDWARGGRVLDQAELHYAGLAGDPYLRAKIALNRAVSLRATQGPQAALAALDTALSAAREAGHRDYQAEATWHHARCARDGGDAPLSLQLARRAHELAERCGYRWLQAQAALLISELQIGDEALSWATQGLTLGEALQSRSLQVLAHGRLAELMRERGELGPAWHHAQQRQKLEATLNQTQLPARLEALAGFDTDPTGIDALLLSLAGQAWTFEQPDDFARAWQRLRPQLMEGLGLTGLQLWWDRDGAGRYVPQAPADAAPLEASALPGYLDALSAAGRPLLIDAGLAPHRFAGELGAAPGGAQARLDVGLRLDGRLAAFLWLQREPGAAWSRAEQNRAQRLAALLERMLAQLGRQQRREPGVESTQAALAGAVVLAGLARQLRALLANPGTPREELAELAARIAGGAERIEQQLRGRPL